MTLDPESLALLGLITNEPLRCGCGCRRFLLPAGTPVNTPQGLGRVAAWARQDHEDVTVLVKGSFILMPRKDVTPVPRRTT